MIYTTLIYTLAQSASVVQAGNGMSGYQVTFTVTEATNITDKIFVLQRETPTADANVFTDTFYDVASVAQLQSVPLTPTLNNPFYRVNTISLIFPNLIDLGIYVQTIKDRIALLQSANDLAINMQASVTITNPSTTLARYSGMVPTTTILAADILAAAAVDYVYSKASSWTVTNSAGARYLFVALRADLTDITTLAVNSVTQAVTKTTVSVTNASGYTTNYSVWRTNSTFNAGTYTITTT